MSQKITVALIGGTCTIIAAIAGAILGNNFGESHTMEKVNQSIGEVSGDNANITFNDINDFIKDYQNVKTSNDRFASQLEQTSKELEELKQQIGNTPIFKFRDLQLTIDGKEIPISSIKSMVTIDGKEYYSKELAESFLHDNQNIIVKDDTMFIGKVIADKANLVDQRVVDTSGSFVNGGDATDSYGNTHFNSITCGRYDGKIIYNLNRKYSFLKCSFSINEDGNIDQYTNIVVEADNVQVYNIKMTKLKEPVLDVEIPINNCSLLQISCANKDGSCSCIISDAIVYN